MRKCSIPENHQTSQKSMGAPAPIELKHNTPHRVVHSTPDTRHPELVGRLFVGLLWREIHMYTIYYTIVLACDSDNNTPHDMASSIVRQVFLAVDKIKLSAPDYCIIPYTSLATQHRERPRCEEWVFIVFFYYDYVAACFDD